MYDKVLIVYFIFFIYVKFLFMNKSYTYVHWSSGDWFVGW